VRRAGLTLVAALGALLLLLPACNRGQERRAEALAGSTAVEFPSTDGVRLEGRLFGDDAATTGVVLSHMLPADQSSWWDLAGTLEREGYLVLTYDFRGYCPGGQAGCSDGEKDVSAIWQDVLGAIDFIRSHGVQQVALVGASMGGTASLVAASKPEVSVDAVITLSAPASIEGLAASAEVLQAVSAAKLFVAGAADFSAADSADQLYAQSPPPKRIQILPTGDHGTDILEGSQSGIATNLIVTYLAQYAAP
jgi:pimeloyl-ACP methyl ester carboxylesterase